MKKLMIILASLLCTGLLAGCAGSPAQASLPSSQGTQTQVDKNTDGNAIEPGDLISKEEAAQILGQDVKDGVKKENPEKGQKSVLYDGTNVFIHEYLEISMSQQVPEGIFPTVSAGEQESAQKKDGIGYKYIFHTPGLHILSNGYYLIISGGNFTDETVHKRLSQAGALAAANLNKLLGK